MKNPFVTLLITAALGVGIASGWKAVSGYYRTAQAAAKMEAESPLPINGTLVVSGNYINTDKPTTANIPPLGNVPVLGDASDLLALPTTMPAVTTARGLLDGEGVTAKASDLVTGTALSDLTGGTMDTRIVAVEAMSLRAGSGYIRISFDTGKVEIPDGLSNDKAAKAFWQAVERYVPRTAQSLEGKIVVTREEAEEVVRALDILKRYSSSRWAYEPSVDSDITIGGFSVGVVTSWPSYDNRSEAQKLEDEAENLEASAKQKRAKAEQMKNEERDVKWAMATLAKWRKRVKEAKP